MKMGATEGFMRAQIEQLEEENKKLKEDLEFVYGWKDQLEKENERLKEELEVATKCSSQEEGKLRKLEKENKRLREENEELKEYKSMYEGLC